MSKKFLLGLFVQETLKDLMSQMGPKQKEEIESKTDQRLRRVLGDDWTAIPATGPYMMASMLIMNLVLVPYGITPKIIAEKVVETGKKWEMDEKFIALVESAKNTATSTGEFTSEKVGELMEYSKQQSKRLESYFKENFPKEIESARQILEKGKSTGKDMIDVLKKKSSEIFSNDEKYED